MEQPLVEQAPVDPAARDAEVAAAAQVSRGEVENASRAAQAAAGSALDAPGVGSGPAGRAGQIEAAVSDVPLRAGDVGLSFGERIAAAEQANARAFGAAGPIGGETLTGPAGVAPGIFDALGAHGPRVSEADRLDARELRRARLSADMRRAPLTGSKLAATLPTDQEALDDYLEAGFDFVVVSRQDGRRRAGVLHPAVATLRRTEDFSERELRDLHADPMLVMQLIRR